MAPEKLSKSIVLSILRRSQATSAMTNAFEDIEGPIKEELAALIPLLPDEEVLVASISNESNWMVITTHSIRASRDSTITTCPIDSLVEVIGGLGPNLPIGVRRKEEFCIIRLRLVDRQEIDVKVESGSAYFGILSVLNFIANRMTSRPRAG